MCPVHFRRVQQMDDSDMNNASTYVYVKNGASCANVCIDAKYYATNTRIHMHTFTRICCCGSGFPLKCPYGKKLVKMWTSCAHIHTFIAIATSAARPQCAAGQVLSKHVHTRSLRDAPRSPSLSPFSLLFLSLSVSRCTQSCTTCTVNTHTVLNVFCVESHRIASLLSSSTNVREIPMIQKMRNIISDAVCQVPRERPYHGIWTRSCAVLCI